MYVVLEIYFFHDDMIRLGSPNEQKVEVTRCSFSFRKEKKYVLDWNAYQLSHPRFKEHKTMLLHEPASTFDRAHF